MAKPPEEHIIPLPGAYQGGGKDGEKVLAIPTSDLTQAGLLVSDGRGNYGLRIEAGAAKTHWVRHSLGGAALTVLAAFGVAISGVADPWVTSAKNLLGMNPTIPGRSATPNPSAAQESVAPTPSTKPTFTTSATTEAKQTPEQCVASFSTKQLIGSSLLLSMRPSKGEDNLSELAKRYNDYSIGGIVIAGGSLDKDYNKGNKTLNDFINAQDIPPVVAVTQEGGSIVRVPVPKPIGTMPSQAEVGKMSEAQLKQLEKTLNTIYADLAAHGITMVLGPNADIGDPTKNGPMKNRMFSKDPETVAKLALLYAKTAEKYNITVVYKHAFGLSSAQFYPGYTGGGNSDQWPMYVDWSKISKTATIPYVAAKDQGNVAVMMGAQSMVGVTVKDTSTQLPAMFSSAAVKIVDKVMGPNKLKVTDDIRTLSTKKAGLDVPHAIVAAMSAGVNYVEVGVPMPGQGWAGTIDKTAEVADEAFKATPSLREQVQAQVLASLNAKKVDPCSVRK